MKGGRRTTDSAVAHSHLQTKRGYPEFQQISRRKSCHFQSTENRENVPSLIYEANITLKIRCEEETLQANLTPTQRSGSERH